MKITRRSFSRGTAGVAAALFTGYGHPVRAADKIVLRIGTVVQGNHPENVAARKIKQILEPVADRLDVRVFTDSQIGDQRTMIENLRNGVQEMTWVTTGYFGSYEPILNVLESGYLFRDSQHSYKVYDGPLGEEVKAIVNKYNVRVLGFFEAGMRHVTNRLRPVNTPDDLKGLKIRTPQAKYHLNTLKYMGANPVAMSFAELYTAMQQGVVDGQENPISNIHSAKFYEVNKHLALTGHLHLTHMVMYSERLWGRLPPDLQKLVQSAIVEAQEVQRAAVRNDDATLLQKLKEAGMQVTTPDRAAFRATVLPLREEAIREFGAKAKEWIDRIEAA